MVILVGLGGILGALLRYSIGMTFAPATPGDFPLGTFIANMAGSFILAWLIAFSARFSRIPKWLVTSFGTGTIGSFTTFSTFSVETVKLLNGHFIGMALFYVLTSLIGGWVFSLLGYQTGRGRALT